MSRMTSLYVFHHKDDFLPGFFPGLAQKGLSHNKYSIVEH